MNLRSLFLRRSAEDNSLVKFILSTFGARPKNLSLYNTALTHSSILPSISERVHSNERLEFLGDAILDSVVATNLYNQYPNHSEGELTKLKAKLVSRKNLNSMAQSLGIEAVLKFSINAKTQNTSLLGNALEALIGALFLDLGYNRTEMALLKLLNSIDLEKMIYEQRDYKSLLYEWAQQNKKDVNFNLLSELKAEGRTSYDIEVLINNNRMARAEASSKKKAQQKAAELAIKKMNL
ncbi:MAG: ribonuclease III [Flavobacteriales bacterium]